MDTRTAVFLGSLKFKHEIGENQGYFAITGQGHKICASYMSWLLLVVRNLIIAQHVTMPVTLSSKS